MPRIGLKTCLTGPDATSCTSLGACWSWPGRARHNRGIGSFMLRYPRVARFMRYAVSSAAASATSAITLAALYRFAGFATAAATVVAFCAGAVVSFIVARFWAWRHSLRREARAIARNVAGYAVVVVTTALIATGASVLTEHATRNAGLDINTRTLLIEVAYFGAFAVTFVAKFLVLDKYVFAGSGRRSRAQVDSTTPV